MTLLESLKKSREMWQWLADHPDVRSKWVYFEWLGVSAFDLPINKCYVCDAVLKSENGYECDGGCPIEWIKDLDIPYACEGLEGRWSEDVEDYIEIQPETGYSNWCAALPDEDDFRKESALEIVKLHDEAIAGLEEEDNGTDQG